MGCLTRRDNSENDSEMLVAAGKQLPTMQFPTLRTTTAKHYQVVVTVTWSVPDSGRQLGSRTLAPQIVGDLRCQAGVIKCQVVQVGSPVFLLEPLTAATARHRVVCSRRARARSQAHDPIA